MPNLLFNHIRDIDNGEHSYSAEDVVFDEESYAGVDFFLSNMLTNRNRDAAFPFSAATFRVIWWTSHLC